MIITCPNCNQECELDDEPAEGQHLLCPFCDVKFNYTPQNAAMDNLNNVANVIDAKSEEYISPIKTSCRREVTTKCPHCGTAYEVDESLEGDTCQCSVCNKDFVVNVMQFVEVSGEHFSALTDYEKEESKAYVSDKLVEEMDKTTKAGNMQDTEIETVESGKPLLFKMKTILITIRKKIIAWWKNGEKGRHLFFSKVKVTASSAKDKTVLLWNCGAKGRVAILGVATLLALSIALPLILQRSAKEDYELGLRYRDCQGVTGNYAKYLRLCRKSAEAGYANAQNWLGTRYYLGIDAAKNKDEAIKWYRMAAGQGHARSMFELGLCYEEKGVLQDKGEADKWFHKAVEAWRVDAERGDAEAQYEIGRCYGNGRGVAKDTDECLKWYFKSAEQGHVEALTGLGSKYKYGWGVVENKDESEKRYRRAAEIIRNAAEQGEAKAQYMLGQCYSIGEGVSADRNEAIKWYRKAAEQGYVLAQMEMADAYEEMADAYENKDKKESMRWLRKAAEQGYAKAQFELGRCYAKGKGVAKSMEKAAAWYRKASDQGLAEAQWSLGSCYHLGAGVSKNATEGVKWLKEAALQGLGVAQLHLGLCYEYGDGVSRDWIEAARWYQKAAVQDIAEAQYQLGLIYMRYGGTANDKKEAIKWLRKASAQGHEKAQEFNAIAEGVDVAATPNNADVNSRVKVDPVKQNTGRQNVSGEQSQRRSRRGYNGGESVRMGETLSSSSGHHIDNKLLMRLKDFTRQHRYRLEDVVSTGNAILSTSKVPAKAISGTPFYYHSPDNDMEFRKEVRAIVKSAQTLLSDLEANQTEILKGEFKPDHYIEYWHKDTTEIRKRRLFDKVWEEALYSPHLQRDANNRPLGKVLLSKVPDNMVFVVRDVSLGELRGGMNVYCVKLEVLAFGKKDYTLGIVWNGRECQIKRYVKLAKDTGALKGGTERLLVPTSHEDVAKWKKGDTVISKGWLNEWTIINAVRTYDNGGKEEYREIELSGEMFRSLQEWEEMNTHVSLGL